MRRGGRGPHARRTLCTSRVRPRRQRSRWASRQPDRALMAEPEEERHLKLSGEFDCAPEPLPIVRHSTSHVMAQAVKRLFPDVKLAIGPAIEDGFYYDFLKPAPFTPEDLERLESAMREIIKADYPFVREEMPREAAIKFFEERDEPVKVDILRGIDAHAVSLYRQGDFVDLCRGPHVRSTG